MEIIPLFDRYLGDRGMAFEAIVVGGAAWAMLGLITRETRDCEVIEPHLPETIREASRAFAKELDDRGIILRQDWLNNGPALLADLARRLGHGL